MAGSCAQTTWVYAWLRAKVLHGESITDQASPRTPTQRTRAKVAFTPASTPTPRVRRLRAAWGVTVYGIILPFAHPRGVGLEND